MVNDRNSFAGTIQPTRSRKLDTRQPCGVHEKNFLKNPKPCVVVNVDLKKN